MQVQNNTPQTCFKAIMVPKESQRRFMIALKEECPKADQLLRCVQILEKEKNNPNHAIIRDLGYIAGQECNGHLIAYVNNENFSNIRVFFNDLNFPKFLKKISDKAGKHFEKPQQLARKAQDLLNEKELIETSKMRKEHIAKGYVTEEENCHYLLGEIYKLINYRPKA